MTLRVCVCWTSKYDHLRELVVSKSSHLTGLQYIHSYFSTEDEPTVLAKLQSCDIVLSEPEIIAKNRDSLGTVKWAHSIFAGVEPVTTVPSPLSFTYTRDGGSYGEMMSEYTIAQIINREKHILTAHKNQLEHGKWFSHFRERLLSSLSIGILGVGVIGCKVAEVCKRFGMTVWGLTRTETATRSPHVDHYRLNDGLSELLANCDYVCNILPSTPKTVGMLNGDVLKACSKKKSVFINIGRGDIVSEAVLLRALREGWLGGAVLDVFESEPLPEDSELWREPQVLITPHIAGKCSSKCVDVFLENLELFMANKQLKHTVDQSRGY